MLKNLIKYAVLKYKGFYVSAKEAKNKANIMLSEKGDNLDRIGFVEGTDKASVMATKIGSLALAKNYLQHYDLFFNAFREENFSMIEFGCADGASLRTWEQYFPNAQIYGVDLDNGAKRHETERIHVVVGDATAQKTFDELKSAANEVRIIIDDASHAWSDQRRSFELFWDMLEPDGFYVCEDLQCGSSGAYSPPKILDVQPFFEYMQDRCEFLRWCSDWRPEENSYHFDHLPPHIQKIEREMDMCIFIPGAVIIRKKVC